MEEKDILTGIHSTTIEAMRCCSIIEDRLRKIGQNDREGETTIYDLAEIKRYTKKINQLINHRSKRL